MPDPVPSRPAGAARLAGDEYQHLVSWNEALLALRPGSGVSYVTVEAPDVGNLDDIVVEHDDGSTVYTQVKHAVDAQTPVGAGYLLAPGSGQTERAQRSLLQRFRDSWQELQPTGPMSMQLVTDREIDPTDALLAHLDRRTECLVPAILADSLPVAAREARQEWATHLDMDEDALVTFLTDLRLRTGRPLNAELERAETLMWGHGLTTGRHAVSAAIAFVRDWVQQRHRRLSLDELDAGVAGCTEPAGERGAVLVVEAIGDDPHPEDASEHLRWVERYVGDDPNSRRELADHTDWERIIGPQIEAAGERLRAAGHRRVIVRGALRLPAWFAVGAALRHVHGFDVAALQHGEIWSSDTATTAVSPKPISVDVGAGEDLVLAVGITTDATQAVQRFIGTANLPVGSCSRSSRPTDPARRPSPMARRLRGLPSVSVKQ